MCGQCCLKLSTDLIYSAETSARNVGTAQNGTPNTARPSNSANTVTRADSGSSITAGTSVSRTGSGGNLSSSRETGHGITAKYGSKAHFEHLVERLLITERDDWATILDICDIVHKVHHVCIGLHGHSSRSRMTSQ